MHHPSPFLSAAPVFLSAEGAAMSVIRQALSAHPRFFTSHLPCDCRQTIEEWAQTSRRFSTSRRPVWLSNAAFACASFLQAQLPGVRFVRVLQQPCEASDEADCLVLQNEDVLADPPGTLARILSFLGEAPVLARCA
jgi:hypothetical protein